MARLPREGFWFAGLALALSLVPAFAVAQSDMASPQPAAALTTPSERWAFRMQGDAPVEYHGLANFDAAGLGTGGMVYPAFGVAGLFAAMLTHGVVVDAAKQKQKSNLQAVADQVLEPYRSVLDVYNLRELMERALGISKVGLATRLIGPDITPGQETLVESMATFALTQDQKAIVLENLVAIQRPGTSADSIYRNTIRVVSAPRLTEELPGAWLANNGERLKEESARLMAESLDIAVEDVGAVKDPESVPFKTVRYAEGGAEKIERAQVLQRRCDRLLIRTLRGALMSVPVVPSQSGTTDSQCKVAMAGS